MLRARMSMGLLCNASVLLSMVCVAQVNLRVRGFERSRKEYIVVLCFVHLLFGSGRDRRLLSGFPKGARSLSVGIIRHPVSEKGSPVYGVPLWRFFFQIIISSIVRSNRKLRFDEESLA